jgi:uncharacterized membrane protein YhhN
MPLKKSTFLGIYILLVLFDLACGFEVLSNFRILSKPLILLSLIVYFIGNAKSNRNSTFYLFLGALICSLLGDIFLLFDQENSLFFTLGLASFLIAHILFVLTFIKKWNAKTPKYFWFITLLLFSYGGILFYILMDSLGSLKLPVILYILGILAMVISAYRRLDKVPYQSFNLVLIGAFFFVLSDSVLAINKFLYDLPLSHILIMGSYATAQYLITKGISSQEDFAN